MQTSDFINAENLIPMVNKCVRQTGTLAASSDRQKRTLHDSDFLMKQSGTVAHTRSFNLHPEKIFEGYPVNLPNFFAG